VKPLQFRLAQGAPTSLGAPCRSAQPRRIVPTCRLNAQTRFAPFVPHEPRRATIYVLRQAFESAGVEFIDENGGGAGVRWQKPSVAKPETGVTQAACGIGRLMPLHRDMSVLTLPPIARALTGDQDRRETVGGPEWARAQNCKSARVSNNLPVQDVGRLAISGWRLFL